MLGILRKIGHGVKEGFEWLLILVFCVTALALAVAYWRWIAIAILGCLALWLISLVFGFLEDVSTIADDVRRRNR